MCHCVMLTDDWTAVEATSRCKSSNFVLWKAVCQAGGTSSTIRHSAGLQVADGRDEEVQWWWWHQQLHPSQAGHCACGSEAGCVKQTQTSGSTQLNVRAIPFRRVDFLTHLCDSKTQFFYLVPWLTITTQYTANYISRKYAQNKHDRWP